MEPDQRPALRTILAEKLVDSLEGPIFTGTRRRTAGTVQLKNKVTAVIGMRRSGKTTFLHQLRQKRIDAGTDRSFLPYINFEDERLGELDASRLGFILEEYRRRVPGATGSDQVLWCFDEIQGILGWEQFIRRMLDSEHAQIAITGSSSALLSREIATALRGRAWEVAIYPFSFAEALDHAEISIPDDPGSMSGVVRGEIEHGFLRWLTEGGFPEAQGLDTASRQQLLMDYTDVAILRDVVERHKVSNVAGLRWMVRHLLGNAGSLFSAQKFHHALKSQGLAISRDTVYELLSYLEDAFLVRLVWMESNSERQRMVNPRKAYPVDTGLIPLFDRTGRSNVGHALETAVYIELERRKCDVTYVRTPEGFEVDFLARGPDGKEQLIQVCADVETNEVADREFRALEDAATVHPGAGKLLLTLTRDGLPGSSPPGISAMSAYEWMLAM